MSGSVNKAIIVGNLGVDPEIRSFPSGQIYCALRIATSERWKDKNTDENREKTEWHNVSIYSEPVARFAEQYLRKGSKVYVEGKIETRKWQDQSGNDRYRTEIAVRGFSGNLTSLGSTDGTTGSIGGIGRESGAGQELGRNNAPANLIRSEPDIDDDIPF